MAKEKEQNQKTTDTEIFIEKENDSNAVENAVEKNKNVLILGLGILAALIVGGYFLLGSNSEKEKEAQLEIYKAQYYFNKDSLNLAAKGDGVSITGMEDVAEEYSGTKAGNLANFYNGVIQLKQGNYELAIDYLKEFDSDDLLVQARAYSLIGDANMELGNTDEAISAYKNAVDYKPNSAYTPGYLMKLTTALESNGNNEEALKAYKRIVDEFPASQEASTAKKYIAKLEIAAAN